MPGVNIDTDRLKAIVIRSRKGEKPTEEEHTFILQSIDKMLDLDDLNISIKRFTKKSNKTRCMYSFELSNGKNVEINSIEKLQKEEYVLDRFTEQLDMFIAVAEHSRGCSYSWGPIVQCLLAVVESIEEVESYEYKDEEIVREWVINSSSILVSIKTGRWPRRIRNHIWIVNGYGSSR